MYHSENKSPKLVVTYERLDKNEANINIQIGNENKNIKAVIFPSKVEEAIKRANAR